MTNPLAELFVRLTLDDREFQHQLADALGDLEAVESTGQAAVAPARRGSVARNDAPLGADDADVVALLADIRQTLWDCKGLLQTMTQRGGESRLASP